MIDQRRASPREPIRLLLVEDSRDDRQLICDLLDGVEAARYAIEWAEDLAAAHDRVDHGVFDVCLLDLQLPDGHGLDLLEAAMAKGVPLPFVVVTGHGTLPLDRRAMALGAAGFLDKNRLDGITLERALRYAIRQQNVLNGLAKAALRDEATGLITRVLFRDRLAHALANARRRKRQVAVMMIDLAFQGNTPAKDSSGNDTTTDQDQVDSRLAITCRRLVDKLRETDTVARLGNQQCALIFEGLQSADHARTVARKVIRLLSSPIAEMNGTIAVKPSIGIALYPRECGDVDGLLRQAEAAMRRVKAEDGQHYGFGSEQIDRRLHHDLAQDELLKRAIERGDLVFRFHPKIDLTNDAVGVSAEIAAGSSVSRLVSAEKLRSVADDHRLIEALCNWMLSAALVQLQSWRQQGLDPVDFTLPFPLRRASDLKGLDLALRRHLEGSGIDAQRIEFDLDENLVTSDLANGGHRLAALKAHGVRLALDGFGRAETGLHGLGGELLDSLKLSPRLYRDLPGEASRENLVKAIIGLGHDLDLRVVASGVRDDRQFAFLRRLGCDALQLRMSCPPLSPEAATAWLQQIQQERREKGARTPIRPTAARQRQPLTTASP